jgi:hypothetical protein
MSNARNLSKFKPSSSGLVETADIADDAINADKIADNAVTTDRIADDAVTTAKVNPTQTDITSVGTLTSATISGDLTVDTNTLFVDASENNVGIGTTTPATSLEISGTSANTQGGVFPRIQISTTADNNPTYSGSLDIVEKQSSATSTAVFGENHLYGFRMMLDGFNNVLKWFGGSQTTVTERMGLDRDTGNLTGENESKRIMTLKPGEFAFFPWDMTFDLRVDHPETNANALEAMLFVRTTTV